MCIVTVSNRTMTRTVRTQSKYVGAMCTCRNNNIGYTY